MYESLQDFEVEVYTSVDWVTIIYENNGPSASKVYELVRDIRTDRIAKGYLTSKFRMRGYIGWQIDNLKVGSLDGKTIVCASGALADKLWLIGCEEDVRVTRVDLEVTASLPTPDRYLARRWYDVFGVQPVENQLYSPKKKYISSSTGDTLYVGERSSDNFARMYDKTLDITDQLIELGKYWRYECEFKGDKARAVVDTLKTCESKGDFITATVYKHFLERGIRPVFDTTSSHYNIVVGARSSDVSKKLAWMQQTVAPVVAQLKLAGFGEDVVEALNLKKLVRDMYEKESEVE